MTAKQPTPRPGLPILLFCALIASAALAICAATVHYGHLTSAAASQSPAPPQSLQLVSGNPIPATDAAKSAEKRALAALGNLPLAFEANQGQTDPQVKYLARGQGYTLFLTSGEAVFSVPANQKSSNSLRDVIMHKRMGPSKIMKQVRKRQRRQLRKNPVASLRMKMLGANPLPAVAAENLQPGKKNYMIGRDPKNWHTSIPLYAQVHYRDVYPGVDMLFHGARQLEFDFVVNPEANPDRIELGFSGAQQMRTENSGDLVLSSAGGGEMRLLHPVAYQENNGTRQPVDARFVVKANHEVTFALGPYDRTRQLVIDPSISFSTYLGGSGEDEGQGLAVDASGNVYVTGQTGSDDFPGTSGTNITSNVVFLSQITSTGTLGFSALFGGTGGDDGTAVAVDSTGIYVAGVTDSPNFPVSSGAAQTTFCGGGPDGSNDGFAAKIAPGGTAITWATFITDVNCSVATTDSTIGFGIAVDSSQDVYVVGETFDAALPVVNYLFQGSLLNNGAGENGADDGFVAELNPAGSAYLIMSYLGGSNGDLATGIAWQSVSGTGIAYVTGATISVDLPTTSGAFQPTCGTDTMCNSTSPGGPYDDAFVASFNPITPSSYLYLTYLGGELSDLGLAITADATGNAYITGQTASTLFPVLLPYQSTLGGVGAANAYVTKLNPTGTAPLIYSSYLGGSGTDTATSIALDSSDNAYITGPTTSANFPQVDPTQAFGGASDAFVSQLNWSGSALSLPFSSFLGGSGDEDVIGGAVAVDATGNVDVTGDTDSPNFPVTSTAFDKSLNQGVSGCTINNAPCPDAFVVKYSTTTSQVTVTVAGSGAGTVTSSVGGINCPGTCFASLTNGTQVTLTATPGGQGSTFAGWSGACTGTSTCTLTLTSNQLVTATFNGNASFTLAASALSPSSVSAGASATSTVTITPTGGFNASTVSLTCSSITPSVASGPSCSFGNIAVANGIGTATLTVSTTGPTAQLAPPAIRRSAPFYALWLPIGAIAFLGAEFSSAGSRKKRLMGWLLLCLVLSGLVFLASCSNNNNNGNGTGTPSGTYTITVSGTGGSINKSASPLTLTVQ
jgi:hypothetical protein